MPRTARKGEYYNIMDHSSDVGPFYKGIIQQISDTANTFQHADKCEKKSLVQDTEQLLDILFGTSVATGCCDVTLIVLYNYVWITMQSSAELDTQSSLDGYLSKALSVFIRYDDSNSARIYMWSPPDVAEQPGLPAMYFQLYSD